MALSGAYFGRVLFGESMAKRRLADEYDAAQDRGDVAKAGGDKGKLPDGNFATAADIGLTHKEIHEARQLRDAERATKGLSAESSKPLGRILHRVANAGWHFGVPRGDTEQARGDM